MYVFFSSPFLSLISMIILYLFCTTVLESGNSYASFDEDWLLKVK